MVSGVLHAELPRAGDDGVFNDFEFAEPFQCAAQVNFLSTKVALVKTTGAKKGVTPCKEESTRG